MTTPTDLAQALPELPEPFDYIERTGVWNGRPRTGSDPVFDDDQMRAYAIAAIRAHESRAQLAAVPDPDWLANLRHELMLSKITHNFTLTRDELAYILGDPLLAQLPAQPASVADGWQRMTEMARRMQEQHAATHQGDVFTSMKFLCDECGYEAAPQPPAKESDDGQ